MPRSRSARPSGAARRRSSVRRTVAVASSAPAARTRRAFALGPLVVT
ncbi:hypothetical protein ACH5AO_19190 [Streptomyces sp. NPDC018964]